MVSFLLKPVDKHGHQMKDYSPDAKPARYFSGLNLKKTFLNMNQFCFCSKFPVAVYTINYISEGSSLDQILQD